MPKRKFVYATRRYTRARKTPTPRRAGGFMRRGRSSRGKSKGRVPILWLDRTVSFGLGIGQADTFPTPNVVKLHYNRLHNLQSTGTAGTFMPEELYRLNNIYDTVFSVGGTQPYYYDTLFGGNGAGAPYREWRVLRTKVEIQFFNDNSTSTTACFVGCGVGLDLSTTAQNVAASQLLMQRPNTRVVPCTANGNDQSCPAMTFWVDHKQLLGVKDMKDADNQVGTYNSGPNGNSINLLVFQFPVETSSTVTYDIWYRLHITFYVEARCLNTVDES